MAIRITKRVVDAARPSEKDTLLLDAEIKGFGLKVTPAGKKVYILQYRMGGRGTPTRRYTIGEHGSPWTPDKARTEATRLRGLVADGIDPAAQKKEERAKRAAKPAAVRTVRAAVDDYVERYLKARRRKDWKNTRGIFYNHVLPRWGDRDVKDITRDDALDLLRAVVAEGKPIAANRVLSHTRKLFKWCRGEGFLSASPIHDIDPPSQERRRQRVLKDDEIKLVWRGMDRLGYPFGPFMQLALVLAQRRTEVAGIQRCQVNPSDDLWILPPELTKSDREHAVPLPPLAKQILDDLPDLGPYYFTTTGDRPISGYSKAKARLDEIIAELASGHDARDGATLTPSGVSGAITITAAGHAPFTASDTGRLVGIRHGPTWGYAAITTVVSSRTVEAEAYAPFAGTEPSDAWRLGIQHWTIHDLRRTAGTGMGRLGVSRFVRERILNHADNTIGAVYDLYEYLPEKRHALDLWSAHLTGLIRPTEGNVVPLRPASSG